MPTPGVEESEAVSDPIPARWAAAWRKRLDEGGDPSGFVQSFRDEPLVVLLQATGEDRATGRNQVLAETMRRISGRPSDRSALAADILDDVMHDAGENVNTTARAVRETGAAVESKATGELQGPGGPGTSRTRPRTAWTR